MAIITILVLWTWGLTPIWVNTIGTVLCGVNLLIQLIDILSD